VKVAPWQPVKPSGNERRYTGTFAPVVGGMIASALHVVGESLHELFATPHGLRQPPKNVGAVVIIATRRERRSSGTYTKQCEIAEPVFDRKTERGHN
jgi:hypothetical protein